MAKRSIGAEGALLFFLSSLSFGLDNFPGASAFLPIHPKEPPQNYAPLPIPNTSDPTELNLTNAVLLALRRNPDLQIDFNNRKVSRYDLFTAEQALAPQVNLTSSFTTTKTENVPGSTSTLHQTSVGPTVTWDLPTGSVLGGSYTYNPSFQTGDAAYENKSQSWNVSLTQHLLQGFGWDINLAPLRNAQEAQQQDDYQLANNVITTIIQVSSDYYRVVQARQTLLINQLAEKDAEETLHTREALFEAGRISQADLTQAKLSLTQKQMAITQSQQLLNSARETLTTDLGLPDDTNFHVDTKVAMPILSPDLAESLREALASNLDLKIARLNESEAKRNLQVAENGELPTLDLVLQDSRNQLTETNTSPATTTQTVQNNSSVSLNLTVPLDRVSINQKSLQAAMDIQNAQITLHSQEIELRNQVVTAIQNLDSLKAQLESDLENQTLAEEAYASAKIKYQYGKLDAFTLSEQQEQMQTAESTLVNDRIAYLEALMNYEKLVGSLLPLWHIHLSDSGESS